MHDTDACHHDVFLATKDDAVEMARLFTTLGHPIDAATIEATWEPWEAAGNVALAVRQSNGALAGVATIHQMHVLHRPKPVGRITSLVVDQAVRGDGIGRALVAAAERMLVHADCGLLEITTNTRLVGAHDFYEHLGYQRTSIRLAKTLTPAS